MCWASADGQLGADERWRDGPKNIAARDELTESIGWESTAGIDYSQHRHLLLPRATPIQTIVLFQKSNFTGALVRSFSGTPIRYGTVRHIKNCE
jgi:hypothetical protein